MKRHRRTLLLAMQLDDMAGAACGYVDQGLTSGPGTTDAVVSSIDLKRRSLSSPETIATWSP